MSNPKVIYVGVNEVGDFFRQTRDGWDFAPFVPNVEALYKGLAEGTISNDFDILLILDLFFDPEGQNNHFEKLIATIGKNKFVGIINYRENFRSAIKERIEYEGYNNGQSDNISFYFIDRNKPSKSLDDALSEYNNRMSVSSTPQSVVEEKSKYLGQVVAVTSSKGGSGKSTVGITLASYIAHASYKAYEEKKSDRPLKVIIVDLDVRDGQLGFITGQFNPTVIKLRAEGISSENIDNTVIHNERLKCDLLLAPRRPRGADDTPANFYLEVIQLLKTKYDYIFLDTSVNYLDPLLEKVAYPMADQIIYTIDVVIQSIFSMARWIQEVTSPEEQGGMGISKTKIGIVVNKLLQDINMPAEKIKKAAGGLPIISVVPSNPRVIAHATNIQSLDLLLKHEDISSAIGRIATAVVGDKHVISKL